jgi:hypothetical protein
MYKKILSLAFFFVLTTCAFSQNSEYDSLLSYLNESEKKDFEIVNHYLDKLSNNNLSTWLNVIDTITPYTCYCPIIEKKLILTYKGLVFRSQNKLILKLDNGMKKYFYNKSTNQELVYYLDRFYPDINYYLIHYKGWETGGFYLVNKANGVITDVPNRPILSPEKNNFIVFNVDLDSEYTPNVIKLYDLKNNCKVLYQDYFLKSQQNENQIKVPIEISWLSEKEIVIKQGCSNGDDFEYRYCGDYRLLFNERWYKSK